MEQENESSESRYATHDLPGIGEFRAKKGTATHELAGAVAYWERQYRAVKKTASTQWRAGFLTGLVSSATITAALLIVRYFIH